MRPLRAGTAALLTVASTASLLTACGKAGGSTTAGAQLPSPTTLAEVDRQLHAYLESVTPVGGKETGVRAGSILPSSFASTACPTGQASHILTEAVVGTTDTYASTVLGILRARGWHFPAWSSDSPKPGTRFTNAVQAGYTLQIEQHSDTVTVYIQTPCLPGTPMPTRSDFPDNSSTTQT